MKTTLIKQAAFRKALEDSRYRSMTFGNDGTQSSQHIIIHEGETTYAKLQYWHGADLVTIFTRTEHE